MIEKIGVLGLGRMGGTAARLLLESGHKVFAVDRPSTRWLLEAGGELVVSPQALGETASILLVLLAREEDVEQAIFGSQGLAKAKKKEPICTLDEDTKIDGLSFNYSSPQSRG
jgi:3-hydroxyisobutyrate dehydrogenase-like beta-hydroxyacid dehydrogenase